MRTLGMLLVLAATAAAQSTEPQATGSQPVRRAAPPPTPGLSADMRGSGMLGVDKMQPRIHPLMNVEITDRYGVKTKLVAFHRVSGEIRFVGFLGAASIDIPYEKIKSVEVATPEEPGGRMRAIILLQSGKTVNATFDAREGEQLFSGYAEFGRVTIFWRDLRRLEYLARTKRRDLPVFGKPARGVDVRLTDRDGVQTELVGFRRTTGENILSGLRGSSRVEVPLRVVKKIDLERTTRSPLLHCRLELKGRKPVDLRLKSYHEQVVYRGRAEFGDLRIQLGEVREIIIRRSTPALRDLDPVAAAEGREVENGKTPRR